MDDGSTYAGNHSAEAFRAIISSSRTSVVRAFKRISRIWKSSGQRNQLNQMGDSTEEKAGDLDQLSTFLDHSFLSQLTPDPDQNSHQPNRKSRQVKSGHYVKVLDSGSAVYLPPFFLLRFVYTVHFAM